MGRRFGWLWAAYSVSAFGTWLAFDAFALIAVLVLHADSAHVALLAATGPAVGALLAMPLGLWTELRRKRPVMAGMDLVRCVALLTIPASYAFGRLGLGQLLVVSVLVASADITFNAASGAFLKGLVPADRLLTANARFESTNWTASVLGPPLGGAVIGVFGPVTTVVANAVSFLLSALGIRAVGGTERPPERTGAPGLKVADLFEGWRHLLTDPRLRPLFLNSLLANSLLMAAAPPLAVLMLGPLGFAPWQYGLAFAVPCLGGLVGSRLARPLVARHGQRRILLTMAVLRVVWPLGLAFVRPGLPGLLLVMAVELGVITGSGVFSPVLATYRLERTPDDRLARTLSAWSVTGKAVTAGMTALWGLLGSLAGPRTAIALAGVLLLATPLTLLRLPAERLPAERPPTEPPPTEPPSPATARPSPAGPPPSR
ncbi:MFS transporter [Streptomyces sp. NPDC048297]|uniref:MFS transporter n=1 Tax=Streptomyces sp. NPDC048297 TaxID=3365531 RepID=UPI00371D909E